MAGDDLLKLEMHFTLYSLKICVVALDGIQVGQLRGGETEGTSPCAKL